MEAVVTGVPYKIGGNVLNEGLISNLPADACVEVPCLIDNMGVHPCKIGRLPVQLAAMNMTNINTQLMTIEAAVTRKRKPSTRPPCWIPTPPPSFPWTRSWPCATTSLKPTATT